MDHISYWSDIGHPISSLLGWMPDIRPIRILNKTSSRIPDIQSKIRPDTGYPVKYPTGLLFRQDDKLGIFQDFNAIQILNKISDWIPDIRSNIWQVFLSGRILNYIYSGILIQSGYWIKHPIGFRISRPCRILFFLFHRCYPSRP